MVQKRFDRDKGKITEKRKQIRNRDKGKFNTIPSIYAK
jgi:hypothetical protein